MPKQDFRSGKSGRSSKTARVLNLLTDPDSIESSTKPDARAVAGGAKLTDDRKAQAKIRNALEDTLEMELSETPATPARPKRSKGTKSPALQKSAQESEQPPAQESENAEADWPSADWPSADWPSADWPSADSPSASEQIFPTPKASDMPLENAINELRAAGEEKPDEYICFNVMQALVEDKADKYMKMFGLCTCNRCHIDVVALALSNLPPKYVVAKPHELIPRLSMYEQKFSVVVVTQVMSACRKVLDRPHHQRKEN